MEGIQVSVKNVPVAVLDKMQLIADTERVNYNVIYNKAFELLVDLYEKKHGKLKPKPKGKGLDLI